MSTFSSGIKSSNTVEFKLLEEGYYEMKNVEVIVFTQSNASSIFTTEFDITIYPAKEYTDEQITQMIKNKEISVYDPHLISNNTYEGTPWKVLCDRNKNVVAVINEATTSASDPTYHDLTVGEIIEEEE